MIKKCPQCQGYRTKKFGTTTSGKQRWRCENCGKTFSNKGRKKTIEASAMWNEYVHKRQTIDQLSERFAYSPSTIKRRIDSITAPKGGLKSLLKRPLLSWIQHSSESEEKINLA